MLPFCCINLRLLLSGAQGLGKDIPPQPNDPHRGQPLQPPPPPPLVDISVPGDGAGAGAGAGLVVAEQSPMLGMFMSRHNSIGPLHSYCSKFANQ